MLNRNRHEIIGHVGSDPDMRYTPTGVAVANFSVATTSTWKDSAGNKKEATEWTRVVCFGRRAELVSAHVRRGAYLCVVGRSQTQGYTDRDGIKRFVTKLVASSCDFLSPRAASDPRMPTPPPSLDEPADLDDLGSTASDSGEESNPF
jgi:single-strand DNA-binding protein